MILPPVRRFSCLGLLGLVFLSGACRGGAGSASCPQDTVGRTYVVNSVAMPASQLDFAIDFDANGSVENRYGEWTAALSGLGLDSQIAAESSIRGGETILLIRQGGVDPTFQRDFCASAVFQPGLPQPRPDFDGTGSFSANPSANPVRFSTLLSSGVFIAETDEPSRKASLVVGLPIAGVMVPVSLVDARVSFVVTPKGLAQGTVNGGLLPADVPSLFSRTADLLNARIASNPSSPENQRLLALFDQGPALDPEVFGFAECNGIPGDGRIDGCEISAHPAFAGLLTPDVRLSDDDGFYPAISVGFGFSAVFAQIVTKVSTNTATGALR
jgi:hypothetical protein